MRRGCRKFCCLHMCLLLRRWTSLDSPEDLKKLTMNSDSVHSLTEETQVSQMQQSSLKPHSVMVAPASSSRDAWDTCLPFSGPQSHVAHSFCAHSYSTNQWDICEELRLRELEEVKARAAQMEKTMRWWSDCTANWREKWSKVRAERNSAREEGRQLRMRLEMTMKELSELKKKQSLSPQKETLEAKVTQELKLPSFIDMSSEHKDEFQSNSQMCESVKECLIKRQFPTKDNTINKEQNVVTDPLILNKETKPNLDGTLLFKNDGAGDHTMKPGLRLSTRSLPLEDEVTEISALRVHLDEFQKIIWKEREMRAALEKEIERLESALSLWKWKYAELKDSKPKTTSEADILLGQHEAEIEGLSEDMKKECKSQNGKNRVIFELRAEELLNLQHAYSKLSRRYQAKMAELTKANNHVDQNEAEIKKLRFQLEELKEKLTPKEDKILYK
ncbi:coiled-coil domain-containing protein 102B [Tupaia chinensis]|uniref:coiled-coil domain-containing protein 102B n=1 Tax=Tupaia chinensis TaxID=246437 RepID=UPI0003C902C0|nr:coiled-coil domain-containing protein 102B [Tupaia chinensis]